MGPNGLVNGKSVAGRLIVGCLSRLEISGYETKQTTCHRLLEHTFQEKRQGYLYTDFLVSLAKRFTFALYRMTAAAASAASAITKC